MVRTRMPSRCSSFSDHEILKGCEDQTNEKKNIFLRHVKLGPVKARPVEICEDRSSTARLIPTQYNVNPTLMPTLFYVK